MGSALRTDHWSETHDVIRIAYYVMRIVASLTLRVPLAADMCPKPGASGGQSRYAYTVLARLAMRSVTSATNSSAGIPF